MEYQAVIDSTVNSQIDQHKIGQSGFHKSVAFRSRQHFQKQLQEKRSKSQLLPLQTRMIPTRLSTARGHWASFPDAGRDRNAFLLSEDIVGVFSNFIRRRWTLHDQIDPRSDGDEGNVGRRGQFHQSSVNA